jgi:hypothetical protein
VKTPHNGWLIFFLKMKTNNGKKRLANFLSQNEDQQRQKPFILSVRQLSFL